MKTLIFTFSLLLLTSKISFTQPDIGNAEVLIRDSSGIGTQILVKVYPVGAVFSGFDFYENLDHKYSLNRCRPALTCHWPVKRLIGAAKTINFGDFGVLDFDDGNYFNTSDPVKNARVMGGISFGLWKFEFYEIREDEQTGNLIEECFIDYRDFNLGVGNGPYGERSPDIELKIVRKPNSSIDSLVFKFLANSAIEVIFKIVG